MPDNQDRKERLIRIFQDTRRAYESEPVLQARVRDSTSRAIVYAPEDNPLASYEPAPYETLVRVTRNRTLSAAKAILDAHPDWRVAVHDFASATNPGGGVERGSSAQEESICRCTTLYPTLQSGKLNRLFYKPHRDQKDVRYTDACAYVPDVAAFRADDDSYAMLHKDDRYLVDVLVCAAPNLRPKPYNAMNPGAGEAIRVSDGELFELHVSRARHMLCVAAAHDIDALVLGAFGCGAFRNDPEIVANAYAKVLPDFKGLFRHVEFAVYCTQREHRNYDEFRQALDP